MKNEKKNIGIITLYYNNYNYGGLLQSYALCEKLNKMGYDAKQISFYKSKANETKRNVFVRFSQLVEELSFCGATKKIIIRLIDYIKNRLISKRIKRDFYYNRKKREKVFCDFMTEIPHTEVVNEDNIRTIEPYFETFITGSDQVWKPGVYCDEYFLRFTEKNRVSYAASIGRSNLAKSDLKHILNSINGLNAISLREKEAVELFANNGISSSHVVDPTLLLSKDEWDLFSEEYQIGEKYLFCYFLGKSKKHRIIANKFAEEHKLKIVTLPYLSGYINDVDDSFGDYMLYDVSPKQFVYLIKKAEYIFTDSFHASVFSGIFYKKFIVFEREEEKTMNGRVISLLDLFDASDRFATRYSDIDQLPMYTPLEQNKKFQQLKSDSISFLSKYC